MKIKKNTPGISEYQKGYYPNTHHFQKKPHYLNEIICYLIFQCNLILLCKTGTLCTPKH